MTLREKHPLICIELAGPRVLAVDLGKPSHDSSIDYAIPRRPMPTTSGSVLSPVGSKGSACSLDTSILGARPQIRRRRSTGEVKMINLSIVH